MGLAAALAGWLGTQHTRQHRLARSTGTGTGTAQSAIDHRDEGMLSALPLLVGELPGWHRGRSAPVIYSRSVRIPHARPPPDPDSTAHAQHVHCTRALRLACRTCHTFTHTRHTRASTRTRALVAHAASHRAAHCPLSRAAHCATHAATHAHKRLQRTPTAQHARSTTRTARTQRSPNLSGARRGDGLGPMLGQGVAVALVVEVAPHHGPPQLRLQC